MLTVDGRRIDFQETPGAGPAILFVPGSYSTPAAWRSVQRGLPAGRRLVATSLCGYGATEETRRLDDLDMAHEVRVIEAVARRIGGPVHLVGHSFGGTVALAAALAGAVDALSITTFEANPLLLMRERGRADLLIETRRMSGAFEAAWEAGERDAAGRIIDFWGGDGSFAAMPEPVQAYCRDTAWANVLDWRTAYGFEATLCDYARLGTPVLLVRGSLANAAMVSITDGLAAALPDVRTAVVEGARHFLITSHPEACAGLIARFLAELEMPVRGATETAAPPRVP